MRSRLSLEITSRLLILVANATLIVSGQLYPVPALLSGIAIATSFVLLGLGKTLKLHPWWWNGFTLCAFLAFIPDLLWLADSALDAAVHLLLYLMIYRLYHLDHPRAHLQLALVAFLQILAATQYSSELFLGFCFLIFLILGVWTLILIQTHPTQAASDQPERMITPAFFVTGTALSIGAFVFTLGVFFVVPRVTAGLFSKKDPEPVRVAGFSERVDFGSIGPIKLRSSIVMRVMVSNPAEATLLPLYLRGMAFDAYDGRGWSNRLTARSEIPLSPAGFFRISQDERTGVRFRQQILLEPLGTRVLFGFSHLTSIGGSLPSISMDPHGSIYLPSAPASRVAYTADSRVSFVSTADLKAESFSYPGPVLEGSLQRFPDDQKIVGLAQEVTRSARTVYEKAKAIEAHLKQNYRYSLNVQPDPDRSAMDDFLFGQKTGYCEHFATAMVLMLRGIGIPSRLATGFLPGEWNGYGNYYMVRQSDAHAWVEAYFPQSGWVTFDPTPPEALPGGRFIAGFSHYVDHLRIQWERYIVNYSPIDQAEALTTVRNHTETFLQRVREAASVVMQGIALGARTVHTQTAQMGLLIAAAIGIGILLYVLSRKAQAFPRRLHLKERLTEPSTELYLSMLRILESKGFRKKEQMTPTEFLQALHLSKQDLERAEEITRAYYRTRFGGKTMTAGERTKIETLLKGLLRASSQAPCS